MRMIEFLLLLIIDVPTWWCAPQLLRDSCQESGCRVSDVSLNSALSTFLCYTEKEYEAMGELEKKIKLAEKIVPQLLSQDGSEGDVEKLLEMDSDRLVGLANLILHSKDIEAQSPGRKTEEQFLSQLIDGLVQKTNFSSRLFEQASQHSLALLSCQMQNNTEPERDGRGAFLERLFGCPGTLVFGVLCDNFDFSTTTTSAETRSTTSASINTNSDTTIAPIADTTTVAPMPLIDISWSFGMTPKDISCIVPGTKVNFIWSGIPGHNVVQLANQSDYDSCQNFPSGSSSTMSSPSTFTAANPGTFYFVCGLNLGFHCNTGNMKAKITVKSQC